MRGNIPLYGIPVNGMRSMPVAIPGNTRHNTGNYTFVPPLANRLS